jgi:hypothetical protein
MMADLRDGESWNQLGDHLGMEGRSQQDRVWYSVNAPLGRRIETELLLDDTNDVKSKVRCRGHFMVPVNVYSFLNRS